MPVRRPARPTNAPSGILEIGMRMPGSSKGVHMAMNENVAKVLEEQINKELFSAYLYLTFADYYEERGLKGFANWYEIQVKE